MPLSDSWLGEKVAVGNVTCARLHDVTILKKIDHLDDGQGLGTGDTNAPLVLTTLEEGTGTKASGRSCVPSPISSQSL